MSQSIAILGRQPALGIAELESLFGEAAVSPLGNGNSAVLLDVSSDTVVFTRLGGCVKLGTVLARLPTVDWQKIEKHLRKTITDNLQYTPEGKLKLGLSVYDIDVSAARVGATALTLKKVIRTASGGLRSVRIIPNKELELNSAQVLHNGLTTPTGWEILIVADGTSTVIAQTTSVQDIDAYAARDQGRPKRDARVGMLPPKLAQTIVNLAAADSTSADTVILDPFCGTGVVLQEAVLMGFGVYGTDLEPRMVDFTTKNLEWLEATHETIKPLSKLEVGDATSHVWNPAPSIVACEGYLGQPFTGPPTAEKLSQVRMTCNLILKKFLQNIGSQIKPGTRLCLAVPAWQQRPGEFAHLPLLDSGIDHLENMGYNRVSFKHVKPEDLVYARADQIVARELLVLTKN
jgi:tRNA G10  N-methylase Trm11